MGLCGGRGIIQMCATIRKVRPCALAKSCTPHTTSGWVRAKSWPQQRSPGFNFQNQKLRSSQKTGGMFRRVQDVQTMHGHRRIGRPGPAPARATAERANLDHVPAPGNRLSEHLDDLQLGFRHPSGNIEIIWHLPLAIRIGCYQSSADRSSLIGAWRAGFSSVVT